ncbi:DNA recombination protein RmuC [Candidatus Omnitrophota bacterium]
MNIYLSFIIGLAIGIAAVMLIYFKMKDSFKAISYDALLKNSEDFLKRAEKEFIGQSKIHRQELEGERGLIEQTFTSMKARLDEVQKSVADFEKDRKQQFGAITNLMTTVAGHSAHIQNALASSRIRGQWGERMAEDILRLAGFIEGVNYKKQKAQESGRPDFTFALPQDLIVNMDVKFPFENYLHYLETREEAEKTRYKDKFLKDVKSRIKEVTTRDYINPAANTVDYVILFIPNEQIYAFINEIDRSVLDEALKNKVILCSPLTLYAILAVIRQAVDNFNLERTAGHILSLLGAFNKQWDAFIKSMDKMGSKIDDARTEFDALVSTRRQQLERPLKRIEELRTAKGITIEMLPDEKEESAEEPESKQA